MKQSLFKIITFASILATQSTAWALSSDKEQPVAISADNVDYNFATGERIYDGNVVLIQGSLKVEADRLVAQFNGDAFDKATATGTAEKRAKFQQRPDGKDDDVIGIGDTLVYDESNQKMEIITNAELMQANQKASGAKIVYDIAADKMNVTGGGVEHDTKKKTNSNVSNSNNGRSKLVFSQKERIENKAANPKEALEAVEKIINPSSSQ